MSDYALCVIVEAGGKVSRKSGFMIVSPSSIIHGTVGGGIIEANCFKKAVLCIERGESERILFENDKGGFARIAIYTSIKVEDVKQLMDSSFPLVIKIEDDSVSLIKFNDDENIKEVLKNGKDGLFTLDSTLYYVAVPYRRIIIIGGGHVAKAVYDLSEFLNWQIEVVEKRDEYLSKEAFPLASRHKISEYDELPDLIVPDKSTALVILTKGLSDALLNKLHSKGFCYFGLLGGSDLLPWYSPIGLDLGGERVNEVALSIVGEINSVFNDKAIVVNKKYENGRLAIVRGAGDLATGVIITLKKAGFRVIATEISKPTVIRRTVAFADAVYKGEMTVEDISAIRLDDISKLEEVLKEGKVPVIIDEDMSLLNTIKPDILVDAILAKKNLGTKIDFAPFTIALGPGFCAGVDVDVVVETKRGHNLGRLIYSGSAEKNTGIPGDIMGFGKERVVKAPRIGIFKGVKKIGDIVKKGEIIAYVDDAPVFATLDGMLRGLLNDGLNVTEGFKIADIDPRGDKAEYLTVSDKARSLGTHVLLAIDNYYSTLLTGKKKK